MRYNCIFLSFLFLCFISCDKNIYKNEIIEIFDVRNDEVKFISSYSQFGGFNEGFLLEEYEISKESVAIFLKDNEKTLPNKNKSNQKWEKIDWSSIPPNQSIDELFIMSLNYSDGNDKLESKLKELKKLLENSNVYYAFYYRLDIEYLRDVIMFILDVETNRIYVIENNI